MVLENNSYEIEDNLVEVAFARDFQEAIINSSVLQFKTEELKEKIENTQRDQLLVVTSTINSPKVIEKVEVYNKDFIKNSL